MNKKVSKDILINIKKNIKKNNKEWITYYLENKNNTYFLKESNNNIMYKYIYQSDRNNSITDNKNNPIKFSVNMDNLSTGTFNGILNGINVNIIHSKTNEKITINLLEKYIRIIGIINLENPIYDYPYYNMVPMIFLRGTEEIGYLDKNGSNYKLVIKNEYKKYLPLFFQSFVILQLYLSDILLL